MSDKNRATDRVPLPPKDADVITTACDYCIVACGYKVYRWPVGKEGGPRADENALGLDYPVELEKGGWLTPNMHNVVSHEGKPHNVIVAPDQDATVVNVNGNHSIRGGCIAQKCYNPETPTRDRLKHPMIRIDGELREVSWDTALDVFAEVSKYVIDKYGVHSWAQKMFSYHYFENTYALTKLALVGIRTPAFAWHDNPSVTSSTPGFRDVGIDNFGPSYEDYSLAETLVISGTDPFETKTVLFNHWIMKGVSGHRAKIIMINPRKTAGCTFAEETGGLHLWITPGTDTVLHLALARIIIENGWEDSDWIKKYTSNKWEIESGFGQGTRNTPWQWRTTWGKFEAKDYAGFKEWILSIDESKLDFAARTCGLDADDIHRAAELMARPRKNGNRPRTMLVLEKGNYWSNNYTNSASYASLGLLCGAGNRPGQMIGRMGGHQRGGVKAGRYPLERSPEKFAGRRRKTLDLDRWVENGNVRFAYVIGTTWTAGMTASGALHETFLDLTRRNPNQVTSSRKSSIIRTLKKRVDSGGTVVVNQDIYLRNPIGAEIADIVLPAAGWGEEDLVRANGERRLRVYSKFYDPPGDARPDWWIAGQIGQRMGFADFEWKESNDVFEEAARHTRGSRKDYYPLVWKAKKDGVKGHELLRSYGTTGIQGPVRWEDGELLGTKRLHDSTLKLPATGPQGPTVHNKKLNGFNTQSGKANFIKSPWWLFADYYEYIRPKDGELWVINGRVNEIWQSGFDDVERRPYITRRWPENFIELHPDDAERLGIESGDYVVAESDRVAVQKSGFVARDTEDALFSKLVENGHIEMTSASVRAVAVVMPVPKPGVAFMYFLDPKAAANSLVPRVCDPIANNYRFKLASGKLRKIGESEYKESLEKMTFKSRDIGQTV
ncbi:MAG: arsenate reductase (azurin) large subunit [Proteobacteria bacterium]|nr:arsenate reductase (azurin) large subunit [Pseudomonadota bacterium]